MKKAKVLVCNDSGAMHVASIVDIPIISIFGPTVTSQGYAPWSFKAQVAEISLPCRPCGAHGHRECPIKTHDCMKKLDVDRVWKKVSTVL
jgi:heptosyltransferase-2